MVKNLQKMFKALNSNNAPGELAHAFALGMLLAFVPKGNLLWILLFLLTFFLRINRATLFLSILLGSVFIPLLDSFFDSTGYAVLTSEGLIPFFASLAEIPFVIYTRFNNSVVMGSLVWGIVLYIPFTVLGLVFVKNWRSSLAPKFRKSRLYRILVNIPLFKVEKDD